MSEDRTTNVSATDGGNVPQAGIYKGFNAHITLAGVIIGRGQEWNFEVDNNLEAYYEIGSRTPWYVEGNFECRGTIRSMVFDTMKMRLALGSGRDVVGANQKLQTIDITTLLNSIDGASVADLTPDAGVQPWWKLFEFTITCELHIDGTNKYIEYKLDGCKIDTYRVGYTQDSEVGETLTFVAPRVGIRMVDSTA